MTPHLTWAEEPARPVATAEDTLKACSNHLEELRPGLLPGEISLEPKPTEGNKKWTPSEHFVWDRLCGGQPAKAEEDPNKPENGHHTIRGALIRAVTELNLFDFPGFDRIIIVGFTIRQRVDLVRVHINNFVSLRNCDFQDLVDFRYVSTEHNIELTNSTFEKGISLRGFRSTRSLFLDPLLDNNLGEGTDQDVPPQPVEIAFIDLDLAHVDGVIAIGNIHSRVLDGNGMVVGQLFRIISSSFDELLNIRNATAGSVDVLRVAVGRRGSEKPCSDNAAATDMTSVTVRDSIVLNESSFYCTVSLRSARIGGDLSLRGDLFSSLDVTNAHMGDLEMGPGYTWIKIPGQFTGPASGSAREDLTSVTLRSI